MAVKICYIIIYIFEACILLQYCKNLFLPKYTWKKEIPVLFFSYSLLFFCSLSESFWVNFFSFLVMNFLYIFFMYNIKWLTAFFHSFVITIIMVLSELGILVLLSYFVPDFYDNGTYFRNVIMLSVPSKILYFLILQSISLFIKKRKTRELSSDQSTFFLLVFPFLSGFIALVLTTVCMNTSLSLFLDILITISVILLLAFNIFLAWFHTSIQEKNQKFLEIQIRLQKEYDTVKYFDALWKQDEKQKVLIHDIRKHLLSIAELNEHKETHKIASYIDEIIQSSDLQSSVRSCDNDLLNTILFRFKQQYQEFGISFITNIRSNCINFLSEYDMTALFCNLLENALDATRDLANSFIELSVTPHNSGKIIITMINSCQKDPFSGKGHHLVSTKKNKWRHGYGMTSIQQVIHKFDGSSRLYFDPEDSTFHTIIILKKNGEF